LVIGARWAHYTEAAGEELLLGMWQKVVGQLYWMNLHRAGAFDRLATTAGLPYQTIAGGGCAANTTYHAWSAADFERVQRAANGNLLSVDHSQGFQLQYGGWDTRYGKVSGDDGTGFSNLFTLSADVVGVNRVHSLWLARICDDLELHPTDNLIDLSSLARSTYRAFGLAGAPVDLLGIDGDKGTKLTVKNMFGDSSLQNLLRKLMCTGAMRAGDGVVDLSSIQWATRGASFVQSPVVVFWSPYAGAALLRAASKFGPSFLIPDLYEVMSASLPAYVIPTWGNVIAGPALESTVWQQVVRTGARGPGLGIDSWVSSSKIMFDEPLFAQDTVLEDDFRDLLP
jgi:hypothetical protein